MVLTVPAFVWRGGTVTRGLVVGVAVGAVVGVLAWLDSGMVLGGAIAFVVLAAGYGAWMGRRMVRCWPGAAALSPAQRVAVARTVRSGAAVSGQPQAVVDYAAGLRAAADTKPTLRWVVWLLLAVAAGTALWDTAFGSAGNAIASAGYLVLLGVDVFWWPRREREILANAEHCARSAAKMVASR
jgi:hypothetical protein